jgi:hypothetical protein
MYKNMIRKSLALGAGLALVVSGLAAVPAQAVATGQLWSAHGQTYEMVGVMGHDFTLRFANPAGFTITASTDDAAGIENQRVQIADHVVVSVVPKAGQTASVVYAANTGVSAAANAAGGVVTVALGSTAAGAGDFAGDHVLNPTGFVGIGAPTNLTTSLAVDVFIVYDDGSRSETERVTFLPSADVSTTLAMNPVVLGQTAATGSLSFAGINTENFVVSNLAGGYNATAGATTLTASISQDGTAKSTTGIYSVLTDSYNLSATLTPAVGDIFILTALVKEVEANKSFSATATAASAKFTISEAGITWVWTSQLQLLQP